MLLLTRKKNETIMIGDNIKIELIMSNNDHAVIGIQAPREIEVHRQEIYDRKKFILNKIKVKNHKRKYLPFMIINQKEISI